MWQAAPTEGLLKQKTIKKLLWTSLFPGFSLLQGLIQGALHARGCEQCLCSAILKSSIAEAHWLWTAQGIHVRKEQKYLNCTINGPWPSVQKKKKKRKVHGVKYHKEGNYFNHINEHIIKKMGLGLAEVVWARSSLLAQREHRIKLFFRDAVPTQPTMQERTFKSLFQTIAQTELKHFLVEMQLNVGLSDYHGSVPGSSFRDAAEERPSTFLCFSLPPSEKKGKRTRLRGLHQGKNHRFLPWKSCIQQLKPLMAGQVSAGAAAGAGIASREAEGVSVWGGMSRELQPCLLQTWGCHTKTSFQTQLRTGAGGGHMVNSFLHPNFMARSV